MDDKVRILFNSLDGRFLLATYPSPYFWPWGVSNPSNVWVSPTQYLPYGPNRVQDGEYKFPWFYRAPKGITVGPDNLAHVLWSGDDRSAYIWCEAALQPRLPLDRLHEYGLDPVAGRVAGRVRRSAHGGSGSVVGYNRHDGKPGRRVCCKH